MWERASACGLQLAAGVRKARKGVAPERMNGRAWANRWSAKANYRGGGEDAPRAVKTARYIL